MTPYEAFAVVSLSLGIGLIFGALVGYGCGWNAGHQVGTERQQWCKAPFSEGEIQFDSEGKFIRCRRGDK